MSFKPFSMSGLESSPAPSTPDRSARKPSRFANDADHPSTTPSAPTPSLAPSFTPAGDPSPSYLQSSIGAMSGKVAPPKFNRPSKSGSLRGSSAPLGRSVRGSTTRQPSNLSKQYNVESDEDAEAEEDRDSVPNPANRNTFGLFDIESSDEEDADADADADADEDADGVEYDDRYGYHDQYDQYDRYGGHEDVQGDDDAGADAMMDDDMEYDVEEDLIREISASEPFHSHGPVGDGADEDLLMLATPAADARMRKEADDLFRATSMRSLLGRDREFKFSSLAKNLYHHTDLAPVMEPDNVILRTEEIVNHLYDQGVGSEDDAERLETAVASASLELTNKIWMPYAETLPRLDEELVAKVGPSANEPDFIKASYLAILILRIHHSPLVADGFGGHRQRALPSVLFDWQEDEHNIDREQIRAISQHRPAPVGHSLFWQGVFSSLIRGNVRSAVKLLREAGWAAVRKTPRGELLYTGQALTNIQRVVEDLCLVMESCPCVQSDDWDNRSSDWTLFRLKAKGAKEGLISFAEGKGRSRPAPSRFIDSTFSDPDQSITGLSRKAESQIPWDIYESLQSLYAILVGEPDAILATAQDWCEATLGLFGWWDDDHNQRNPQSPSKSLLKTSEVAPNEDLLDRLAVSLQVATESDFHFDSTDAVEVAVASAFEGNTEAVISFLRIWSTPVAATIAEIASLGGWLPISESQNLIGMDGFDMEDLEVLGMNQGGDASEKDGIKDNTLIHYARNLKNRKTLSYNAPHGKVSRDGWEAAVQVVGRLDSPARSEEIVRELLQVILDTIGEESQETVDKIWRLLNELGMINFAEDTAETFGDILSRDTFRFGQTLWYYALAHRPGKVRDVLNTLMSISLVESTAYPPNSELDDVLRQLLTDRNVTIEQFAKQDLEAAELLGKMLSGYATLRKYYEFRDADSQSALGLNTRKSLMNKQQAASALVAVIASADDNIRGGLYDDTRDAVVSEDFLLALLGEASVFVGGKQQQTPAITLEQIDVLLKAIEDLQTVGSRVFDAADEFFKLVLASGQGLKSSTPADLLGSSTGGSFMMTGSSMMASQLHQSVSRSGLLNKKKGGAVKRGWDWRMGLLAGTKATDVLSKLRLGLTRDLAGLWLEQADGFVL